MTTERLELYKLCGLKEVPTGGAQWHEVIVAGLPVRAIHATAQAIGVQDNELADLLGIDEASMEDMDEPLGRDVSNSLYRIALAFTRTTVKTGGDQEKAADWLRTAQPAIKAYVPILMLQSHIGAEYVFTAIERMEVPKDRLVHQDEAPDAGTAEFEHVMAEDAEPNPFEAVSDRD